MITLPTVTVVCVTTKDYGPSIQALKKTLDIIAPRECLYFSDVPYQEDYRIGHIPIDRFSSVEDYNHFIFKRLGHYVKTGHILVVQHDGYPICAEAWTDAFLQYDYIGAPWTYTDGRNVGNGGFSLRSARLHILLQESEFAYYSPEDEKIARYYRQTLEKDYSIKFAPEELAHRFSFEMHRPVQKTFGFHNYFHQPYREPVILKRDDSMGDVIMLEPAMAWFFDHGYRVILDTPRHYFNLFAQHHFPIEHVDDLRGREPLDTYRTINLNLAYEIEPLELVLKSYYKICGIKDGVLRNSKLNFRQKNKDTRMFDRYVVLHTDDTAMAHRNVHGVNWDRVANYIEEFGYTVLRVGRGNGTGGIKINTFNENMLAYIVGNADYFIGLDSGCGQIAVACEVPSMLFFGSVMADKRYADLNKIKVMTKTCPIVKDGCYHMVTTRVGQDCEADAVKPPCITWSTEEVVDEIKSWLTV